MTSELMEDTVRFKEFASRIPMGRRAESEEYAGPAVFLASNAASYVTG